MKLVLFRGAQEAPPFPEEFLVANGCWRVGRESCFLQWYNHCYVAYAPVNGPLPTLLQATLFKVSDTSQQAKDMKIEILGKGLCWRKMGEGNSGNSYIIYMCETIKE